MNKGIWAIVAIVAFSGGMLFDSMTSLIPAADAAQNDNTKPVLNKLENVLKTLTQANSRLDSVNAEFQEPPDPEKPPIRVALSGIINSAYETIRIAEDIQVKLDPP